MVNVQRTDLAKECSEAETILREIVKQEEGNEDFSDNIAFDESPLKAWVVESAKTIVIYRFKKTAFLCGSSHGHGVVIKRLPTGQHGLVYWSAPLFIELSLVSAGFSFGQRTVSTFAVCTSGQLEKILSSKKGHSLTGIEASCSFGDQIQERTDLLSANFKENPGTVGVSKVSGSFFLDISAASGSMEVDVEKNALYYGRDATVYEILNGKVEPPQEFQPLYGELSRIVNTVEHPAAGPSRVSASLERFSTGVNPDAVMVLDGGLVVRDDVKDDVPKE